MQKNHFQKAYGIDQLIAFAKDETWTDEVLLYLMDQITTSDITFDFSQTVKGNQTYKTKEKKENPSTKKPTISPTSCPKTEGYLPIMKTLFDENKNQMNTSTWKDHLTAFFNMLRKEKKL